MEPSDDTLPVAVIDRVSTLLEAFSGAERLTLSELSDSTGLPRSSTHRMLTQLVRVQWIRKNGHAYELGTKMLELGSLALHHDSVRRAALPIMSELHSRTGLVVHLAVLDGRDALYLEKIGGQFGLTLPTRVGGRQPAHLTAVGKAVLANLRADTEALLDDEVPGTLARSASDAGRLRREFARIREQYVALDKDEAVAGVSCVAAAIGDGHTAVGALSVCGPTESVNSSALAAPVRMAAMATWQRLGSRQTQSGIHNV